MPGASLNNIQTSNVHAQPPERIPHHVGTCFLRPANRNQAGTEDRRILPQKDHGRRLCHVPVQPVPAALRQHGKCRSACEKGKKDTPGKG